MLYAKFRVFAALLFSLILISCSLGSTKSEIEKTKLEGDKIVSALREFHVKNGIYPVQLSELVPAHLDSLPISRQGISWEYGTRESGQRFTLLYDWGFMDIAIITTDLSDGWIVDTK